VTQIVVDTNTSVSALLWGGTSQHLFTVAVSNSIPLLTSNVLIHELEKTLLKPKLAKYVLLSGRSPDELAAQLVRLMAVVEPAVVSAEALRDPDDIHVLAAAVGGKATHIVSGDKDLLVLGTFQNIPILRAIDFIQMIEPNFPSQFSSD
jgi:putative PIN family toxin of toxin-antitoxin system